MMSARTLILALVCAAAPAFAQGTKAPVKPDSTKKAAPAAQSPATKAPNTKADAKQAAPPATKTDTKQAAPGATKTDTKQDTKAAGTKAPAAGAQRPVVAVSPAPQATPRTPVIMREVYGYEQEGRRDPFITLLTSSDLRPTVADLRLTGILYDENGNNSIAIMRDIGTNAQYRVTAGQTLGRMKVALIKRKAVIFSIEAFGLNRQDSLVLGDTTKARAK